MGKAKYCWTRTQIFDLIRKYKQAECLWNSNIEDYKSREIRETAIILICKNLNITREIFTKKIHNLRNQYNYEAKKVYKRNNNIDEKSDGDDTRKQYYYSKWKYFNALNFLKSVISPRNGNGINYEIHQISKSNFSNDDDIDEQLSISAKSYTDDINIIEISSPNNNMQDKKPKITFENDDLSNNDQNGNILQEDPIIIEGQTNNTQAIEHHFNPQIIEIESIMDKSKSTNNNDNDINFTNNNNNRNERNEYDVFGEFVAGELRSLNNYSSRKKLKRKIMEAIILVSNEDDTM